MTHRILFAFLLACGLAAAPSVTFAQSTTTKPAAAEAKPKTTKAKAAADDEDDEPSSAAQKKACDAKWKTEKEKSGAKGWKAYFTFMSKCM